MRKIHTLECDDIRIICFHDLARASLKEAGFGCRLLKRHIKRSPG